MNLIFLVLNSSDSSSLEDVKDWLRTLPSHGLEAVTCGSTSLDEPVVEAIEKAVNEAKTSERCTKTVKVRVRPYVLFRVSFFNPFSPSGIVKFSQLEPILFIEEV